MTGLTRSGFTSTYILLILVFFSQVAASQPDAPAVRTFDDIIHVFANAPHPSESLAVIFIPGILGSKLPGIWGEKVKPELEDLVLRESSPYSSSELLVEYPSTRLTAEDVYGEFEVEINAVLEGSVPYFVFSYDWRQSIPEIAKKLDQRLRGEWASELEGRELIVIAHSMGGLVAWYWKNQLYPRWQEDLDWQYLILLGSPLRGSCEILRMLLEGYRPYPGAGIFERELYKRLFSDLRPAAFTFPSVFQLLPSSPPAGSSPNEACLVVRTKSGRHPMDHLSAGTWERYLIPVLAEQNGGFFPFFRKSPVWDHLGLSKEEFRHRVEKQLDSARRFRKHLELTEAPLDGRIVYVYGNQHRTIANVEIHATAKKKELVKLQPRNLSAGDGRVLEDSANALAGTGDLPHTVPVASSHTALVNDSNFVSYLVDLVKVVRNKNVVSWLSSDPAAQERFVHNGAVVPLSQIWAPVWRPEGLDPEAHTLLNLNLRVVQQSVPEPAGLELNPGKEAYRFARYYEHRGQTEAALAMYETAIGSGDLEGSTVEVWALNNYGLRLIRYGDPAQAWGPLEKGVRLVEQHPNFAGDDLRSKLFNNYGLASEHRGDLPVAISAWRIAASAGSENANHHLARVQHAGKMR